MSDRLMELTELGLDVKISQEQAEEKWREFAREYRIIGKKAENWSALKDELITAIMIGDLELIPDPGGIAIKQWLVHRQNAAPETILYHPPNSQNLAAAGTDVATLTVRWRRIAASLARVDEGQLILWIHGQDLKMMEFVIQLFT